MTVSYKEEGSLPVIDFSAFYHGSSDQKRVSAQIVEAFKKYGFIYLVNHGIPSTMVKECFQRSDDFFNQLPEEERNKPELIRPAPVKGDRNYIARGYSPPGKEKINQNNYTEDAIRKAHEVKDARESFDMGADVGVPAIREPNVWPAEELLPGFKDFCMEFFWTCNKVGMDLFRAVAIGLGLDQEYFVSYHEDADHIFRLQHYPAVEKQALVDGTKARVVPHSDYGSMTLLFQDAVGGLQVEHAKHKGLYIDAPPMDGAIVVNIGDFLQQWTNDILKSTLHRVVQPPVDDGDVFTKERFSIPFFMQADRKKLIQCAPELVGPEGPKYPPVTAMDYLYKRTAASFYS